MGSKNATLVPASSVALTATGCHGASVTSDSVSVLLELVLASVELDVDASVELDETEDEELDDRLELLLLDELVLMETS
jgi:hypothetical protein